MHEHAKYPATLKGHWKTGSGYGIRLAGISSMVFVSVKPALYLRAQLFHFALPLMLALCVLQLFTTIIFLYYVPGLLTILIAPS